MSRVEHSSHGERSSEIKLKAIKRTARRGSVQPDKHVTICRLAVVGPAVCARRVGGCVAVRRVPRRGCRGSRLHSALYGLPPWPRVAYDARVRSRARAWRGGPTLLPIFYFDIFLSDV